MTTYNFVLVDNKKNILLEVDKQEQVYSLQLNFCDSNRINVEQLVSFKIYDLIEKLNPDLIDEIQILNVVSDNEIDVLFKFKHIAKEIGIKQKYMILKTVKNNNNNNNNNNNTHITLKSVSIESSDQHIQEHKLHNLDRLQCDFANLLINIDNTNNNVNIHYLFKIIQSEKLPISMEHLIGLMMKKIFYNVKQFIEKINI